MKKIKLSLLIAFLSIISIVTAQNVSFSVKGGLNMSSFYGDNLTDKTAKPGFHLGLAADLEVMPSVSLQSGLFFSSKGAKYFHNEPSIGNIEYDVNAFYINLPVHIAYKLDVTPGTKVVFHAGPYVAYGVGGKRNIVSGWEQGFEPVLGQKEVNTFNKDGGFKPFDTGVGVGVGAEFGKLILDLGWDMGLINIARMNKGIAAIDKENIKNQTAYLSLGYKF